MNIWICKDCNIVQNSFIHLSVGENLRTRPLIQSHWQLSHIPSPGFEPIEWWHTASSLWHKKFSIPLILIVVKNNVTIVVKWFKDCNIVQNSFIHLSVGKNLRTRPLIQSHWQLSHIPSPGFGPIEWWHTASSLWHKKFSIPLILGSFQLKWPRGRRVTISDSYETSLMCATM